MAKTAEVLERILEETEAGIARSRKAQQITAKISQGKATYIDAEEYALESSRILTKSMARNVPEVLTEERLYRAEADEVIKKPMRQTGKRVAEVTGDIQQNLNDIADIHINAIIPELNEDQIDGIITGICNAESYEAGEETLFTRIENFLEGVVDDSARENADFQYNAGLSPKIERRTVGKCCEWCSRLAGTYLYADVSDKGNDVFRRHKNCHCQVLFNPGDGSKRRQNVHSKQWTDEGKADRIAFAEAEAEKPDTEGAARADLEKTQWEKVNPNRLQRIQGGFSAFPEGDVLNEYIKNVKPEKGYFDVAMHGMPDAVGFGLKSANMKARDLAKIIRRDEAYKGGPVRLLCCNTGERVNGEYCFAEELANALGQVVKAPDEEINFWKNGEWYIGDYPNSGKDFVVFKPNERRRLK